MILALPLRIRWAVIGAVGLGVLGGVLGLVIGLRAYVPTAWAATFEVGIPGAILGGLLGLILGSARLMFFRRRDV